MKEIERPGGGKAFRKLVLLDHSEYVALKSDADKCKSASSNNNPLRELAQKYLHAPGRSTADQLELYKMAVANQRNIPPDNTSTTAQPPTSQPVLVTMDNVGGAAFSPSPMVEDDKLPKREVNDVMVEPDAQQQQQQHVPRSAALALPLQYNEKVKKLTEILNKNGSEVHVNADTGIVSIRGRELANSYFPLLLRSLYVQSRDGDVLPGRIELLHHLASIGVTPQMVSATSARQLLRESQTGKGLPAYATAPPPPLPLPSLAVARSRLPPGSAEPPGKRIRLLHMYRL